MTSLHAALTLAQADRRSVRVAEPLHLDVFGRSEVALEVNPRIAESDARAVGAAFHRALELVLVFDDLHADPRPRRRL
jgi:hypothetical protein